MCVFALFNDDIIGARGTWPSLHYVRLGIVNPVGTGGRPPTHMGWSENREREREREKEREREREREGERERQRERERKSRVPGVMEAPAAIHMLSAISTSEIILHQLKPAHLQIIIPPSVIVKEEKCLANVQIYILCCMEMCV